MSKSALYFLFLQKYSIIAERWEICPQTPCLQLLGALPSDPHYYSSSWKNRKF